jgi:hypothetical protein
MQLQLKELQQKSIPTWLHSQRRFNFGRTSQRRFNLAAPLNVKLQLRLHLSTSLQLRLHLSTSLQLLARTFNVASTSAAPPFNKWSDNESVPNL